MTTVTHDIDLAQLIADTEGEIVGLVQDRDPSTHGLYEMVRYHLALDGSGASGGKRMRPLLGLLAYHSITGDHRRALPGAAAVELGHNFSLVHDDIEDGDRERRHRPTLWALRGVPQAINTGDTLFSLSRIALHSLTDLGFSDAKVLRLMRLYDETCLALCEGQYIDISTSETDAMMSVDGYLDMIGRKTAALIAASIEAGALLATDDDDVAVAAREQRARLGYRLDDVRAAWLRVRFRRLHEDIAARRALTHRYRELLAGVEGVSVPYTGAAVDESSCYVMPILLDDPARQAPVREALRDAHGVQTSLLYPPVHRFTAYVGRLGELSLPRTEDASDRELTLPLFPHLTHAEQERVVAALRTELAA